MLNIIWLLLLGGGIIFAAFTGNMGSVTDAAFTAAGAAVRLAIEMCGVMCLWLGLLKLAEDAGLVRVMANITAPFIRLLFPDVPRKDPALFAIIMNVSANMLGLGNAATPFGLKAMEHLQRLNPQKTTASAPMITLLALNTSCITFIPTLVISLRSQAGSAAPTEIIGATVAATLTGTCYALTIDGILRKRAAYKQGRLKR